MSNRRTALGLVAAAYLTATVAAWATLALTPAEFHPLTSVALADVVATVVIFGWSRAFNNSSFYDAYWSVAPLLIAPWLALHPDAVGAVPIRQLLVVALLTTWGVRLTYNWMRGWSGLTHEDWRYVDLRKSTGRGYWLVSLAGLHMFPTVVVFLGCLPLWPALVTGDAPLSWIDALAAATMLMGIMFELVADRQLHDFRGTNPPRGSILEHGLWSWSRHPNYFGELSVWWGVFLFGWAAAPGTWWPLCGAIAMTGLFTFISIPLIEKRMSARRPAWPEHCRRVSRLLPRPPRSRTS